MIVKDVDTNVSFSPDGRRMAYARGNDPEVGKYRLLTANLDGSDENILIIEKNVAETFPRLLSWSPDGKVIAYSVYTLGDVLGTVKLFGLAAKQAKTFATFANELVYELQWLPGGQSLLVVFDEKGPNYGRAQIGLISRGSGKVEHVTRDTNQYATLTVSADGKTAATVQVRNTRTLVMLPGEGIEGNAAVTRTHNVSDVVLLQEK
jgi:Tol biopolymer transport system component